MAEEETTGAGSEETTTSEATTTMVDAQGNFAENWREGLHEDRREENALKDFKNVDGLAKAFVDTKRMVGKETIGIPNENSSEGDWQAFFDAAGRPTTSADYNLKRPDDLPEELFSATLAEAAQELFYKIGLNQAQADALFAFNNQNTLTAVQNADNDASAALQDADDGLRRDWGNAYPDRLHLCKVALKEGVKGDDVLEERLTGKFGNDPDFIKLMATLGGLFAEHGSIAIPGIPTPGETDQQIAEMSSTKEYIGGPDIPLAVHERAVQKVRRLTESKYAKAAG